MLVDTSIVKFKFSSKDGVFNPKNCHLYEFVQCSRFLNLTMHILWFCQLFFVVFLWNEKCFFFLFIFTGLFFKFLLNYFFAHYIDREVTIVFLFALKHT